MIASMCLTTPSVVNPSYLNVRNMHTNVEYYPITIDQIFDICHNNMITNWSHCFNAYHNAWESVKHFSCNGISPSEPSINYVSHNWLDGSYDPLRKCVFYGSGISIAYIVRNSVSCGHLQFKVTHNSACGSFTGVPSIHDKIYEVALHIGDILHFPEIVLDIRVVYTVGQPNVYFNNCDSNGIVLESVNAQNLYLQNKLDSRLIYDGGYVCVYDGVLIIPSKDELFNESHPLYNSTYPCYAFKANDLNVNCDKLIRQVFCLE